MRALFNEVRDTGWADEPLLSVTINRGIVPQSDLLADTSKKDSSNLDKSKYKLVKPGDIAYNKMRAWQGAVGSSRHRGIVSPAYVVVRPRGGLSAEYLHHLVRTPSFAKEAERWSYGITSDMWSLRPEHFKLIECPVPSPQEQAAIVRYLAHANQRIDQAITAKRKLILLLEEQRQVTINRVVTRGLDPHVSMTESGVPWLGAIPAGWRVVRLKQIVGPIGQGWSPQCDAQPAAAHEWGVLKAGCMNGGIYRDWDNKRLPNNLTPRKELEVTVGDILVNRANTRSLVGSAALVGATRGRRIISDKIFRFRAREDLVAPAFLTVVLGVTPTRLQIEEAASGASSSMLNISQGVLRDLQMGIPPLTEQQRILRHLSAALGPVPAVVERTKREIVQLADFRTRLTADAVTGQVDVRAIAATLPDLEPDGLVLESDGDADDDLDDDAETLEEA